MSSVEAVFGPELAHLSAEEAARKSRLRFVRGKNELGVLYEFRRNLTGHVLTAWEAYQAYGLNILDEALEYGSAILIRQNGIAFLAPIAAVREMAPASDSVSRVMARFGISHTAARHHVRNSRYGQYSVCPALEADLHD